MTVADCMIMGVLNVTPDSFSDGGRWIDPSRALDHAEAMVRAGAAMVDVGGESTRPGAERVSVDQECARVIPVISALAQRGVRVSVDTMRAATAREAAAAGAVMVNDVSGGLADPQMGAVVADAGVDLVVMHWREHADSMDRRDQYDDVVADVAAELAGQVDQLAAAGVARERMVLDPGLGFAKVTDNNWPLLAHMEAWAGPHRVLIGASRKRFLAAAVARAGEPWPEPDQREAATTAVSALAAYHGAWAVRVHDVANAFQAVRVASAWRNARSTAP